MGRMLTISASGAGGGHPPGHAGQPHLRKEAPPVLWEGAQQE